MEEADAPEVNFFCHADGGGTEGFQGGNISAPHPHSSFRDDWYVEQIVFISVQQAGKVESLGMFLENIVMAQLCLMCHEQGQALSSS